MAIPSIAGTVATTTNTGSVSSQAITAPSGIVADELGIIIVVTDSTNQTTDTFNTPTGWTKIVGAIPSNTNVDCHGMAYYRVLTGDSGDDAPTVTWTGTAQVCAWYMRVQDADTSDPINIAGADAQTGSSPISIPSVTTDADNCLVFYYLTFDGGDGFPFSVSGTGWGEVGELQTDAGNNSSSGCFGTRDLASFGASGAASVTTSVNDGMVGVQFAINEAAGGDTEVTQTATVALDLATVAATISNDVNVTQNATVALSLTPAAATVTLDTVVTQGATTALTLTPNAATITFDVSVTQSAATALTLTPVAATVSLDVDITATAAALNLATNQASVDVGTNVIQGATTALNLATAAATITHDVNVIQGATTALTVTTNPATVSLDVDITATTAALTLATNQATVVSGTSVVQSAPVALTLTTSPATITLDVNVLASTAALTLTPNTADIDTSAVVPQIPRPASSRPFQVTHLRSRKLQPVVHTHITAAKITFPYAATMPVGFHRAWRFVRTLQTVTALADTPATPSQLSGYPGSAAVTANRWSAKFTLQSLPFPDEHPVATPPVAQPYAAFTPQLVIDRWIEIGQFLQPNHLGVFKTTDPAYYTGWYPAPFSTPKANVVAFRRTLQTLDRPLTAVTPPTITEAVTAWREPATNRRHGKAKIVRLPQLDTFTRTIQTPAAYAPVALIKTRKTARILRFVPQLDTFPASPAPPAPTYAATVTNLATYRQATRYRNLANPEPFKPFGHIGDELVCRYKVIAEKAGYTVKVELETYFVPRERGGYNVKTESSGYSIRKCD